MIARFALVLYVASCYWLSLQIVETYIYPLGGPPWLNPILWMPLGAVAWVLWDERVYPFDRSRDAR